MSQTLLFSIGVCVFAFTIVGAMVYGRYAFTKYYDAQLASEATIRAGSVVATTATIAMPPEATPT